VTAGIGIPVCAATSEDSASRGLRVSTVYSVRCQSSFRCRSGEELGLAVRKSLCRPQPRRSNVEPARLLGEFAPGQAPGGGWECSTVRDGAEAPDQRGAVGPRARRRDVSRPGISGPDAAPFVRLRRPAEIRLAAPIYRHGTLARDRSPTCLTGRRGGFAEMNGPDTAVLSITAALRSWRGRGRPWRSGRSARCRGAAEDRHHRCGTSRYARSLWESGHECGSRVTPSSSRGSRAARPGPAARRARLRCSAMCAIPVPTRRAADRA